MPDFERALDLYLNTRVNDRVRLFSGPSSPSELLALDIVHGDHFALRLHPRRRGAAATDETQPVDFPADTSIVAALKSVDDLGGDPLALADAFQSATDGAGATWWQDDLNLNTTELAAAIQDKPRLACQLDIEIRDAANTRRVTIPVPATVLAQAYAPADADPTAADPGYPAASDIALRDPAANYRIKSDGTLQLYDVADNAWRPVWLDGGALNIGPPEA